MHLWIKLTSRRHIWDVLVILIHLETIVTPPDIFKDQIGCLLYKLHLFLSPFFFIHILAISLITVIGEQTFTKKPYVIVKHYFIHYLY